MKITENLWEFQKFIDSDNKSDLCLEDTIKFFNIQLIFGQFELVKPRGIRATLIMTSLWSFCFAVAGTSKVTFPFIAMVKMGKNKYKDCLSGKEMNAAWLRKRYQTKKHVTESIMPDTSRFRYGMITGELSLNYLPLMYIVYFLFILLPPQCKLIIIELWD